jgi:hypothetical protein
MVDIAQLSPTVDLTKINNTTPATSPTPSSSSSDSDVVNTASARVYFGPLQSPEKKLIQQITHPVIYRQRTLCTDSEADESTQRRTAQFPPSSASCLDDTEENGDHSDGNDESDDGGEGVLYSRTGTPDNVRFPQDGEWLLSRPCWYGYNIC